MRTGQSTPREIPTVSQDAHGDCYRRADDASGGLVKRPGVCIYMVVVRSTPSLDASGDDEPRRTGEM